MLTVGTYLADRYEIVSKIGAGGMSDVYKAKDHVLGRFVAIKVLKTGIFGRSWICSKISHGGTVSSRAGASKYCKYL